MKLKNWPDKCRKFKKFFGFYPPIYMLYGKKPDGEYIAAYGGFLIDIVKLNEQLQVPDNVSMSDFVKAKYGNSAEKFLSELIAE